MARRKYLDEDGLAYFWGKIKEWVNGLLTGKQDALESGVNIKTVNGESLLGEGNVEIEPSVADYEDLSNKPSVGGVTLVGDKSASDLGLATVSQVEAKQDKINSSNKLSYSYLKDTPNLPNNDTLVGWGFIKNTVNDLANYYRKNQTYTKAEVQTLIEAIKQFTYESVASLPTASSNTMHKIYLVPSSDPQTSNVKDEYITIESSGSYSWEQIGSTAIDLSGYVTTSALNTALADYTTTANLTTLLAGKQDTISDLSTIRSGASLGATAYQKPSTGIPASDLASGVIPTVPVQDVTVGGTSVVSNGTAVIPQEVFWATYGTTTAAEIDAAVAAGKMVMCKYDDNLFTLAHYKSSDLFVYFGGIYATNAIWLRILRSNNTWDNGINSLQLLSNKVTSFQSTPDDTHYPSEKLVKDYVDGICGNIQTILTSI